MNIQQFSQPFTDFIDGISGWATEGQNQAHADAVIIPMRFEDFDGLINKVLNDTREFDQYIAYGTFSICNWRRTERGCETAEKILLNQ